jgi:hypothetical protein
MPPEGRTPYRPFLRLRLSSKMPYHPTLGIVICNEAIVTIFRHLCVE